MCASDRDIDLTNSAGIYLIDGLETGDYFIATNDRGDHIDEFYDGISCPGGVFAGCDPTDGVPLTVVTGALPTVVNFVLDQWGVISGSITEDETGLPEGYVGVKAYSVLDHQQASSVSSDYSDGSYRLTRLAPGGYVVFAGDWEFIDELYDDIACEDLSCDLASGTPVSAAINSETLGIDLALTRLQGEISGRVIDASTGQPIDGAYVRVYDENGDSLDYDYTDSNGIYYLNRIAYGNHFVVADGRGPYFTELYDDIPCYNGPPYGCDPTKGAPIAINNDHVSDIDFELESSQVTGVRGVVSNALTGLPVIGAYVDIWRLGSGAHYRTVSTAVDGSFFSELYGDTYFFSTDTNQAYEEEVYDDVLCPGGSAYQ